MIIEIVALAAIACDASCTQVGPGSSVWIQKGIYGVPETINRCNWSPVDGFMKWSPERVQITDNLRSCSEVSK